MDSTLEGEGVESNNVTFTAGVLHDANLTVCFNNNVAHASYAVT